MLIMLKQSQSGSIGPLPGCSPRADKPAVGQERAPGTLVDKLAGLERALGQRTYVAGGPVPSIADIVLVCDLLPMFEQVQPTSILVGNTMLSSSHRAVSFEPETCPWHALPVLQSYSVTALCQPKHHQTSCKDRVTTRQTSAMVCLTIACSPSEDSPCALYTASVHSTARGAYEPVSSTDTPHNDCSVTRCWTRRRARHCRTRRAGSPRWRRTRWLRPSWGR